MKKQNKKIKMEIRDKFIKHWGKELAEKIEMAAEGHRDGINDEKIGNYFQWCLLMCISYQCLEVPEYRKYHGIPDIDWLKLKKWIKDNAELENYKGSLDYLSLYAGVYDYFVVKNKEKNKIKNDKTK